MNNNETMRLGNSGHTISRMGFGCWAIGGHGWGKVNDYDSVRAVQCALDNGITFYDTADAYGLGKSEILLSKTLGEARKDVVIASKGGVCWEESGKIWTDISPKYLRSALEKSLKRLRMDHIPLYYIHKPDGVTPVQESVYALERMREEGKIGAIGLANFSPYELKAALEVAPISAIQVRLNLFDRDLVNDLLPVCKDNNVTLVSWGALADGLLTGKFCPGMQFGPDDHRSRMPAFKGEAFLENIECVKSLEKIALKRGYRVGQLALRWVLDYSDITCALFGAKTDKQVVDNLGANGWTLADDELQRINEIMKSRNI
jgi:aryl-alcohol dehydrogenase-like predicted oxidoreductase